LKSPLNGVGDGGGVPIVEMVRKGNAGETWEVDAASLTPAPPQAGMRPRTGGFCSRQLPHELGQVRSDHRSKGVIGRRPRERCDVVRGGSQRTVVPAGTIEESGGLNWSGQDQAR